MPNLSSVPIDSRDEWLHMVRVQQMVRVTCLEVIGAAPDQIAEYRREVLKLQELISQYQTELRVKGSRAEAPSSPSTASVASLSAEGAASDPSATPLTLTFSKPPERSWYEGRTLPRFSVSVSLPSGEPWSADSGSLELRLHLRNGRGHVEEQRAKDAGDLLSGERNAVVDSAGEAAWTSLRILEASSKHYGSFTLCAAPVRLPAGHRAEEARSEPVVVQVGRMWSKRRKSEDEVSPDDSINQIPGIGTAYVARLQLQGVHSIRQFAAMAATVEGRAMLTRMCRGDNRRNSLNDAKLQAMIDHAKSVMNVDAKKRARGMSSSDYKSTEAGNSDSSTPPTPALGSLQAFGIPFPLGPEESDPGFNLAELMLLAGDPHNAAEVNAHALGLQTEADFHEESDRPLARLRRLEISATEIPVVEACCRDDVKKAAYSSPLRPTKATTEVSTNTPIEFIQPSPGKVSGFGGFDVLDMQEATAKMCISSTQQATGSEVAVKGETMLLLAAWRGEAPPGTLRSSVCTTRFGCTPLHLAALGGHEQLIPAAAPTGAMLDAKAALIDHATPLALAASVGERGAAVGLALLAAGADAGACLKRSGLSPEHLAAWSGAHQLLAELTQATATSMPRKSASGLSAIHLAALGAQSECLQLLVERTSADVDDAPITPLHCAALQGDVGCVRMLLAARPRTIDSRGVGGWTPAHCSAAASNIEALGELISAGCDIDAADDDGTSPLHIACAGGHADCVRRLLDAGACTSRRFGPQGWTPAHIAAAVGSVDCIHALMASSPDTVRVGDNSGRTALDVAHTLQEIEPGLGGHAISSLLAPLESPTTS